MTLQEGDLLWQPSPDVIRDANITHYIDWLARHDHVDLTDYDALWAWSVDEPGLFWETLWDYFDLRYSQKWTAPLAQRAMPGAVWFPGARLNYAENIFAKANDARPAIVHKSEGGPVSEMSWADLADQTNRLAHALRAMGVHEGDRVVAYLPNIPQAIVSVLAATSLGAIWSSCSPDFGSRSVLDRFAQIEPKVLIAVDGYRYNGKPFDRRDVVAELQASLPTLQGTILIPQLHGDAPADTILWEDALATAPPGDMTFAQVPFDHPLWVLYSSGTTGLPKPIVHGHGGVLLEHAKATVFHNDLKATDRFFWFASTGWMMWNYLIGALLSGASVITYDGSPRYPDMNALFQLAEETAMTYMGISAAFVSACIKAGIQPNQQYDLAQIRGVGSTGSPLSLDGFAWIYDHINRDLALESLSGGTDLCTAFVGGARTKPIHAGEIQGASLGAKVQAWDEDGQPVIDAVGELVIVEPMPSMPIYFWNDPEMTRYRASYFEMYPGVWRHGDWIKFNTRGGCVIYGRSDSTINRQGVRMGTSEIYRVVESLDEIVDSLIIDLEFHGRQPYMPLFVVLRQGQALTDALKAQIVSKLRAEVSPRHVPNDIFQIEAVPYTLSGKKVEVPIRKILLGLDTQKSVNTGALRNPHAIQYFLDFEVP